MFPTPSLTWPPCSLISVFTSSGSTSGLSPSHRRAASNQKRPFDDRPIAAKRRGHVGVAMVPNDSGRMLPCYDCRRCVRAGKRRWRIPTSACCWERPVSGRRCWSNVCKISFWPELESPPTCAELLSAILASHSQCVYINIITSKHTFVFSGTHQHMVCDCVTLSYLSQICLVNRITLLCDAWCLLLLLFDLFIELWNEVDPWVNSAKLNLHNNLSLKLVWTPPHWVLVVVFLFFLFLCTAESAQVRWNGGTSFHPSHSESLWKACF